MSVKFPKGKATHKKNNKPICFVYHVGPNPLKKIDLTEGVCIWAAVEHAMQKMQKRSV